MLWEALIKMKKYYSIDKIIQKSDYQLDHHDLKDLCIRGQLTPCIYFVGNIVCIHEERHQNEIDARELGPHIRSISWTNTFKGYINSDEFLNFIDSSTAPTDQTNVFFHVQKIIEYIDPLNKFQSLAQDEYLKAFPRMTDDDIRNIRWLVEDKHFEGNPFSSTEIVFHHSEVDALFSAQIQREEDIKFFNEYETSSQSDQLERMRAQVKDLEKEKEEYLKKIERLELELDIKHDDLIKASVNNGLLSAIVKKLEDKQSISVDELTHLQENGLCESININKKLYTTPALEAVYGVIQEHWIDYDPDSNQPPPKQTTVTNWIKKHYPAVQAEDIRRYIDKICRHPKAKKGGNTKTIDNRKNPKVSPQ